MPISKTDMLYLGQQQAELFQGNLEAYCEVLVKCLCPRTILLMAYHRLVREGKIIALEDLRHDQQRAAGEMAKEFAKGRLPRKQLIELVKALLAIEYFLNL